MCKQRSEGREHENMRSGGRGVVRHTAAFLDPRSRFCAETARGETPKREGGRGTALPPLVAWNTMPAGMVRAGGPAVLVSVIPCGPRTAVAYGTVCNMLIRLS